MIPKDIFISYVKEDSQESIEIATGLENAGFLVWYYKRDGAFGVSYLLKTVKVIDQCQALLIIISKTSVNSHQVDRELTYAFEKGKRLIALLKDVTFEEFERLKPDWKLALGPSVAGTLYDSTIDAVIEKLVRGLKETGVKPRLQKEKVSVRIRLLTETMGLGEDFYSLWRSNRLKCSYRTLLDQELNPWVQSEIIGWRGGLFVFLKEIPSNALVELQVTGNGCTWSSDLIEIGTMEIPLRKKL